MIQETFKALVISFAIGISLLTAPAARADATVDWDLDNGFHPATVVIGPGENVTWWNYDLYNLTVHITFNNNFNFYVQPYQGAQVEFPAQTGVYSYQDDWGDNGAVIVNVAPSVTITAPTNNASFAAPANFAVQATAGDTADDSVSDVEFFIDSGSGPTSIEDVYSPPFQTTVTNLDAGTYTLIAVARDSRGWTTSDAITITVGASAEITLNSPRMAAGKFLFDVAGMTAGKTNVVQVSTDLAAWLPVGTNVAAGASMTVTNSAVAARQFFRVVQWP